MFLKDEVVAMKKEVKEIKEQSDLERILKMEDNKNKRLCFIIGLLVVLFALSICYIIYLKNDVGTEVTTTEEYDIEQETGDNGNNNFVNGDSNEVNN